MQAKMHNEDKEEDEEKKKIEERGRKIDREYVRSLTKIYQFC
jgi:hypothetical protein